MQILVTGGLGYIGSHTCIALVEAGYTPVVLDNLSNSQLDVRERVAAITGNELQFIEGDIRDTHALDTVFEKFEIGAVMHFAGLKAVGESVAEPLRYYDNNVSGTVSLLSAMHQNGVKTMVFSSSATVYGDPHTVPITEAFPLGATNPYGRSKLMIEEIMRDLFASDPGWRIALLRYFNPVGAHESGLIGEEPSGIPNNLMPYIAQVAEGRREKLSVYGADYPTVDGTGVRDYIHVVDLAEGHVRTLKRLEEHAGLHTYNLGTGRGSSVLEMIRAFEQASGKPIPYTLAPRRPGDIAECYADPSLSEQELGWRATRDVAQMCADTWRWQSRQRGESKPAS
ncbi:UDP-glucose 4-epimerase GalE [Massilia sp. CF038]|uniref:UDP-glucose 4-epimerase GalE n=1 Tax=Massilia sp. CF038 TaxID=1881045 RepID=UPI000910BF76|nr:UDP-glucose 4-epimerase GalE [Massilia sp. CF038]SHG61448.1 UDP-galactose 4-epimerase [Massilia sp. CF038]